MSAQSWAEEAERIARTAEQTINSLLHENRAVEAKLALADAQRDLRDIKRQLADEQREVRASFTDARLQVSGSGQVVGMFAGGKARAAMSRARAMDKRKLAGNQAATLRPYAEVKAYIDKGLAKSRPGKGTDHIDPR